MKLLLSLAINSAILLSFNASSTASCNVYAAHRMLFNIEPSASYGNLFEYNSSSFAKLSGYWFNSFNKLHWTTKKNFFCGLESVVNIS